MSTLPLFQSSNREILAYLGGIVDGEGFIGIMRRTQSRMKVPKFTVRFSVSMTDTAAIQILASTFHIEHRVWECPRRRPQHKLIYTLDVENDDAVSIIQTLLPFLHIKTRQATLAIEFRAFQLRGNHRTKVVGHGRFTTGYNIGRPLRLWGLSDSYIHTCQEFYVQMRTLNARWKALCS